MAKIDEILKRLWDLQEVILIFLVMNAEDLIFPEMKDENWKIGLTFLADILGHLRKLNEFIQRKYLDEEKYVLGYNPAYSVGMQPKFLRNMSPLFSGLNSAKHEACVSCCVLPAGFLLGVFFNPEYRGYTFLRHFGFLSTDYTTLYPRR
jgi:hypothetical protein